MGLELEMIRQDSQCVMIPYHAGLWDWRYRQLANVIRAEDSSGESIGKVEQLVWERRATRRDDAAVMKHFARDAMILRDLMSNVTHVSATGAVEAQDRYANLSVSLTGQTGLIARWSIVHPRACHAIRGPDSELLNVPGEHVRSDHGACTERLRAIFCKRM